MKPLPTPKLTILNPPTSDATGQSSQFLGVLYLALTGLIYSALPATGPWAMAGKALSYLVKLGPIIWWAMPVPASTPPSPAGALRYSWYPDSGQAVGLAGWQPAGGQGLNPGIETPSCESIAGNCQL
ncbi:hypothetical protein DSO57_1014751 [Entomophthora muscae]|uniref:Uncharacterized protein n=1 Tax=Entomophthora muscae TaxID=34485 RepID=A0ACC2SUR9_9FUNG|nr:hypothetical protein DSO57_1014751 [Entomophthora muscae]